MAAEHTNLMRWETEVKTRSRLHSLNILSARLQMKLKRRLILLVYVRLLTMRGTHIETFDSLK